MPIYIFIAQRKLCVTLRMKCKLLKHTARYILNIFIVEFSSFKMFHNTVRGLSIKRWKCMERCKSGKAIKHIRIYLVIFIHTCVYSHTLQQWMLRVIEVFSINPLIFLHANLQKLDEFVGERLHNNNNKIIWLIRYVLKT